MTKVEEAPWARKSSRFTLMFEGYAMIKLIRGLATSPSVPNILRKPVGAVQKKKLFKTVDTLHPIPEL